MTREELIEVMAREILKRELVAPYEGMLTSEVPLMEIEAVVNMCWRARRPFAYGALSAIEAAGVRLVPVEATDKIMRSGDTWGLAFADKDGPAHRISNRTGSGSWEAVATLNCEFSLAELTTHEISET